MCKKPFPLTYIMWSSFVGAFFTGNLMDTLGRRRTIIISGFGTLLSQIGVGRYAKI